MTATGGGNHAGPGWPKPHYWDGKIVTGGALEFLRGIESASEIDERLIRTIEDCPVNKHTVSGALLRSSSDAVAIVAIGVETRKQIADMLRSGMTEIVTLSVQEYLGERSVCSIQSPSASRWSSG